MKKKDVYLSAGIVVAFVIIYWLLKKNPSIAKKINDVLPTLTDLTAAPADVYNIVTDSYTPHDYPLPALNIGGITINRQEPCNFCLRQASVNVPASQPVTATAPPPSNFYSATYTQTYFGGSGVTYNNPSPYIAGYNGTTVGGTSMRTYNGLW